MDTDPDVFALTNDERRRRERPVWRVALGVSVLVHILLFLTWPAASNLVSPFSAAGPRLGDDRAAAGSMQAMNLAIPPSVPIIPPPIPTLTIEPVEMIEFDEDARVQPAENLGVGLADSGPIGLETGSGAGDGGTADEGRFRLTPPTPRAMILPTFADALKDRGVAIWVWVDRTGRVVPDSTRLEPPTSDRRLNERLIAEAADWIFAPARQGGETVASWFDYRVRAGGR